MKSKWLAKILLTVFFVGNLATPSYADVITEGIPSVNGTSYVVIDNGSGEVLFGKNTDQSIDPMGLSQMMTGILVIESGKLDDVVTVGAIDDGVSAGTKVYLREGEKIPLRSLLEATIVYSANDAALAVGTHVGGSADEFVKKMNEKAKEIGMTATTFKSPYGAAQDGQTTTAYDMALLGKYVMANETYRSYASAPSFNWKSDMLARDNIANVNPLLAGLEGSNGVCYADNKSGTYQMVGAATLNNRNLTGVILGAADGAVIGNDMRQILKFGFENTKVVPIIEKDMIMTSLKYNNNKEAKVVAGESFSVTLPSSNNSLVDYQINLSNFELPLKKDDKVGSISVFAADQLIHEIPLVSLDTVRKPINWLFVVTVLLSLTYLAQIVSRIMRNAQKRNRSANRMRDVAGERKDRPTSTGRKTLGQKDVGAGGTASDGERRSTRSSLKRDE